MGAFFSVEVTLSDDDSLYQGDIKPVNIKSKGSGRSPEMLDVNNIEQNGRWDWFIRN